MLVKGASGMGVTEPISSVPFFLPFEIIGRALRSEYHLPEISVSFIHVLKNIVTSVHAALHMTFLFEYI